MEILVFVGMAIVVIAILFTISSRATSKISAQIEKQLTDEFPDAKVFVSRYDFSYVAIDFSQDRLMVGLKQNRGFLTPEMAYDSAYDFDQIAEVALVRDGSTVTSTNRGSQAVGAAVGAVAFGGVGALIGGLSGSTTQRDRVCRVTLRIKADDPDHPIHDVTIFNWSHDKTGVEANSSILAPALKQAEEFGTHVAHAIRRSTKKEASKTTSLTTGSSTSQQIEELWRLKELGALTEEEFLAEKGKILRPSAVVS